ncbi:hypothetical protein Pla110_07150 [Polystyrenella longa]|uniref:Uncharacterized protein n=1 Tax=Polystyrenella longa TaxID=2528007 RepID=A0A518CIF7_9PLAN|nr:hypothetical protein [Polystyrenella longa]QDU79011.1 hypothetical protein Pla110_07150 [Polystyrenella longa]
MKRLMLCSALVASMFFVGGEAIQSNKAEAGDRYRSNRHHGQYNYNRGWNNGRRHGTYYRGGGYRYSPYYNNYNRGYNRGWGNRGYYGGQNGFYYSGPGFSFGIYD